MRRTTNFWTPNVASYTATATPFFSRRSVSRISKFEPNYFLKTYDTYPNAEKILLKMKDYSVSEAVGNFLHSAPYAESYVHLKGLWNALESKKDVNERCPETGDYPLHKLCGGRFWQHDEDCPSEFNDAVELLLSYGADPDLVNNNGETSAHLLFKRISNYSRKKPDGFEIVLRQLLKNMDHYPADKNGWTLLHYAVLKNRADIAYFLLDQTGVDPEQGATKHNITAYDIAGYIRNQALRNVLGRRTNFYKSSETGERYVSRERVCNHYFFLEMAKNLGHVPNKYWRDFNRNDSDLHYCTYYDFLEKQFRLRKTQMRTPIFIGEIEESEINANARREFDFNIDPLDSGFFDLYAPQNGNSKTPMATAIALSNYEMIHELCKKRWNATIEFDYLFSRVRLEKGVFALPDMLDQGAIASFHLCKNYFAVLEILNGYPSTGVSFLSEFDRIIADMTNEHCEYEYADILPLFVDELKKRNLITEYNLFEGCISKLKWFDGDRGRPDYLGLHADLLDRFKNGPKQPVDYSNIVDKSEFAAEPKGPKM